MPDSFKRRSFLKLAGAGAATTAMGTASAELSRSQLQQAAKEDVASRTEESVDDLGVVVDARITYPTTGVQAYHAKLVSGVVEDAPKTYGSALDLDGNPVELAMLRDDEAAAYGSEYGSLTPQLDEHLDSVADGEQVTVGVWHRGVDRRQVKEDLGIADDPDAESREAYTDEVRSRIEQKSQALADALEANHGIAAVDDVGAGEPRVGVTATPSAIRSFQAREDVWRVFEANYDEPTKFQDSATRTLDSYAKRNGDYDASDEVFGILDYWGHPYSGDLDINRAFNGYGSVYKDEHAHKVALAGASTDDSLPGVAHNAEVDVAQSYGRSFDRKITWFSKNLVPSIAVGWGHNRYWRRMWDFDLRLDQQAINNAVNVVTGSGNTHPSYSQTVSTPGMGFNVHTVGAIDDGDTGGDDSDDRIASYSNWKNPDTKHADGNWGDYPHNKPEVSAVGGPLEFPGYSNAGHTGTSWAAGQTAGLTTLLQKFVFDHWSGLRPAWHPELTKAVLMASATNPGHASYDKQGAGVVSAEAAETVIANDWADYEYFRATDHSKQFFLDVNRGDTVRVALSWMTDVTDAAFSDPRNVQSDVGFDFIVWNNNNWWWPFEAFGFGFDTNKRFVEYEASTDGPHAVIVYRSRWASSDPWRRIALAWHRS